MRSTNTLGIQFIIRKNKTRDGQAPIYVKVTVNGKSIEISLRRWILLTDWNSIKGVAKGSRPEHKALNLYFEKVRKMILEIYEELQTSKKLITAQNIKSIFLGEDQTEFTLCKLMDYHNQNSTESLTHGTLKNYFTTQKYIKKYLKERLKKDDVFLSELTYKFITSFEYFLRITASFNPHQPLTNNGIMKHMERLRKMVTMAVKLEWMEKDPFTNYKLKFSKTERGYLTLEELTAIENKKFTIPRLQLVQDLFIFSCYTGLSYIDTVNLTPDKINIGIDGEQWIISKRQKSDEQFKVPLLSPALAIIEKYKDHPQAIAKGKLLPGMSNQKLNSYLKEIADVCGIEKNMTFHLARHTFATTVTLSNGVPLETVSKLLGHSKITTTQIYAKVIERKVSDDMMNLRQKLESSTPNRKKASSNLLH